MLEVDCGLDAIDLSLLIEPQVRGSAILHLVKFLLRFLATQFRFVVDALGVTPDCRGHFFSQPLPCGVDFRADVWPDAELTCPYD